MNYVKRIEELNPSLVILDPITNFISVDASLECKIHDHPFH